MGTVGLAGIICDESAEDIRKGRASLFGEYARM
jgi:hypothetical protein